MTTHVEQYRIFELNLTGDAGGNPYADVDLQARFTSVRTGERICVGGFYRGQGRYSVRFMPSVTGEWHYGTDSDEDALDAVTGSFTVTPATSGNHGRVLPAADVVRGCDRDAYGSELPFRFCYEDGTPYEPYGTTCYAWISQPQEVQDRTLATLAKAPFNKIRMCVFPKFYDFNIADPKRFVYQGSMHDGFDHRRFDEDFFENLDRRIGQLAELGIEADIILLHPYDKPEWGFSVMSREDDEFYLSYMARRYGAYRNVWWSLANEYDLMLGKSLEDWRHYARVVMANDAFGHLRSVHNCVKIYDYNESWCTHCSLQRVDTTRTTECIADWRQQFSKPVICDEAGYEGNIYWGWGDLSGEELMRRFWEGAMRGGYVTHGETFIDRGPQIWWAHGGELHGECPPRIGFMRDIFGEVPLDATPLDARQTSPGTWPVVARVGGPMTPAREKALQYWDVPVLRSGEDFQLVYFGWYRPLYRDFPLPAGHRYAVDMIDTWNMTVESMPRTYEGSVRVELGRQYLAVRIRRV